MKLLICGIFAFVLWVVLTSLMQYYSTAAKIGDVSGPRITNYFVCPQGKNLHIAIAFGREIPPTGPLPPFRGWATLRDESITRRLFDSTNSQLWADLPRAAAAGGFILDSAANGDESLSSALRPGHSYQLEMEFEQMPTPPASIWLSSKQRGLSLWRKAPNK